ncbi:MAG: hypothetical protein QOH21_1760 [Acidobacteriota bacterium]|jgi:diguanylate cyclase (GGDEF)-like protein|nr:hypothetical protein [Acidobacteriota bacterium]
MLNDRGQGNSTFDIHHSTFTISPPPRYSFPIIPKLLAFVLAALAVGVSAEERGFPLITTYWSEEHRAGGQTFDAVQDARGVLYFGNAEGVLTYDGAWWNLLPLPHETAVFGVAANARGDIAAGAGEDFGVFDRDRHGQLRFRSLASLLPAALRQSIGQVEVCPTGDGFVYITEHAAAAWNGSTLRIVQQWTEVGPSRCFADGRDVWVARPTGMRSLDGRTMLAGERVDLLAGSLVVVRNKGLFNRDGQPVESAASQWLRGKSVMGGGLLPDGRTAIVTLRFGVLFLRPDGSNDQIVGPGTGLPEAIIYKGIVDRDGSLWLALEGSIVRVDLAAPLTLIDTRNALKGAVRDVVRHKGLIYAATSHGLFVIDGATDDGMARAREVEGTGKAIWSLLSTGDELFAGAFSGLWRLRDGHPAEALSGFDGNTVYAMAAAPDGSRIWLGTEQGLGWLRRDGDAWRYEGILPGMETTITQIVLHDGAVWCGTLIGGARRIDANGTIHQFGKELVSVALIHGAPHLISNNAVYTVDARDQMVADPQLSGLAGKFTRVYEDHDRNLWLDGRPPRFVRRIADGRYERDPRPLENALSGGVDLMYAENDGTVWFASDRGLYRLAPQRVRNAAAPPPPMIRRIASRDALLFGGSGVIPSLELPYAFRRLRVEFAPLSFGGGTAYQYRLDPIDPRWSEWSNEAFLDYTNLDPGSYRFRLRSRGAGGAVSAESTWAFTVQPPWYRTRTALVLWLLLAAALIALVVRLRTRALRRRAQQLTARVEEQTVALQHTVEQLRLAQSSLVEKNEQLEDANALLAQANVRLEKLSLVDALTSVANRRELDRALADEWERARRRHDAIALVILDLDHFKLLNDTFGHQAGDEALRRVGLFLRETIRGSGDIVARYGGEEFAVVLPHVNGAEAMHVAERLRAGVEALGIPGPHGPLTASCGVASTVVVDGGESHTLVERADRALYAAKNAGRNRVHIETDPLPPLAATAPQV